jgi:hypothetical protein
MVHLLDVNVLVALFDPEHVHHEAAHGWFAPAREAGWATCPLTENGFVRVLSNPSYPGRRTTVGHAVDRLQQFTLSGHHAFWPDDVSLLDSGRISRAHLTGHREVTDTYLLALASEHGGALVTFDRNVREDSVVGAAERLILLG